MGDGFKYYRISYSVFAAIALAVLIYFQYSIDSVYLFVSTLLKMISVLVMIIPGVIIMGLCIKKYFYELSGIQALNDDPLQITLQINGLHKYVRHPLYAGTLLFSLGLFFLFPLLSNLIAFIIMSIYVLIGIRLEEQKLRVEFGDEYLLYSRKVSMLIPGIL
ncbi:MAG: hypothetical protein NVSMB45_08980 [Ginsengibacter sp.]